jgi:hypothetical protein
MEPDLKTVDGRVGFDGTTLTFAAKDVVLSLGGSETSVKEFRENLDENYASLQERADTTQAQITDAVDDLSATAAADLAAHTGEINTRLSEQSNRVFSTMDVLDEEMTSDEVEILRKLTELEATLTQKIASAKASIEAQLKTRVDAASKAVANKFTPATKAVAAAKDKFSSGQALAVAAAKVKKSKVTPTWIGGANAWGMYNRWIKYELGARKDFVDHQDHFDIRSDHVLRINQQGVYNFKYWGVALAGNYDVKAEVRVNGNSVATFKNRFVYWAYWDSMHVDHTMKLKKGDSVSLWIIANYRAWHPSGGGGRAARQYQRASFEFLGSW